MLSSEWYIILGSCTNRTDLVTKRRQGNGRGSKPVEFVSIAFVLTPTLDMPCDL